MYQLEQDIENYITYLTNEWGLSISLHFNGKYRIVDDRFLKYNIHCNNYCLFLKSNPTFWEHCILRQDKVYKKAKDGSFFGMCHAGVYEFVYPISVNDDISGFISVSGYRTNENVHSVLKHICDEYSFDLDEITKIYKTELKTSLPKKRNLDNLILPLCHMFELMYLKQNINLDEQNTLYSRIINYLRLHHTENISIDDLCKKFYCSRSSISHMFKKQNGMSIKNYITILRIEDSKILLKNTNLSIAAIALNVGFSDPSYFTNVFKKQIGISPLKYKKEAALH